ncbi:hypothetical protein BpHYR1_031061 [Brachionus plicatilis]|uniref:Uncharacterized protein n=1 Tax=Brachionus plicatilis TaxID=10195 RepID=A0A3M7RXB6_BRAPC|nr:hypothetical protein BpHYR1_031061 [Brachionus plicatilis]
MAFKTERLLTFRNYTNCQRKKNNKNTRKNLINDSAPTARLACGGGLDERSPMNYIYVKNHDIIHIKDRQAAIIWSYKKIKIDIKLGHIIAFIELKITKIKLLEIRRELELLIASFLNEPRVLNIITTFFILLLHFSHLFMIKWYKEGELDPKFRKLIFINSAVLTSLSK